MKKCVRCGTEMDVGLKFCPNCGELQPERKRPEKRNHNRMPKKNDNVLKKAWYGIVQYMFFLIRTVKHPSFRVSARERNSFFGLVSLFIFLLSFTFTLSRTFSVTAKGLIDGGLFLVGSLYQKQGAPYLPAFFELLVVISFILVVVAGLLFFVSKGVYKEKIGPREVLTRYAGLNSASVFLALLAFMLSLLPFSWTMKAAGLCQIVVCMQLGISFTAVPFLLPKSRDAAISPVYIALFIQAVLIVAVSLMLKVLYEGLGGGV